MINNNFCHVVYTISDGCTVERNFHGLTPMDAFNAIAEEGRDIDDFRKVEGTKVISFQINFTFNNTDLIN